MVWINDSYLWQIIDSIPLLYKKGKNMVKYGCIRACFHFHQDKTKVSEWKIWYEKQMIWKNIIYTVDLWNESTNVSHSKLNFWLKKFEINTRLLYGDLHTILRCHKNKYAVNNQLYSHIHEHAELRTLKENDLPNILQKCGREELLSDVGREVVLAFSYFVHFGIILRNRW